MSICFASSADVALLNDLFDFLSHVWKVIRPCESFYHFVNSLVTVCFVEMTLLY